MLKNYANPSSHAEESVGKLDHLVAKGQRLAIRSIASNDSALFTCNPHKTSFPENL
jgi:hypothetical protein